MDDNKQTVRRLYAAINQRRLSELDELFTADAQLAAGVRGGRGFRESVERLMAAFGELQFTLHDVFAEGDRVLVRWTMRGRHQAPFAGLAATGREVVQEANVVYRFEGARIAQVWMRADTLGLYQQLGAVDAKLGNPAPSTLSAPLTSS